MKLDAVMRRALPRRASVVLAVSGGLDSMVLLDVAARLARRDGREMIVATFDHGSGPHSARAASFVGCRASEYGFAVVIGHSGTTGGGSEAEWRAARWAFLRSIARATSGMVVTAHTRDDQIETVLMRALRGAGARGLAGLMAPSLVIRPFLEVGRTELRAYAIARALQWMEDPTNRSPRFLRNRVRRELLPALRRVQPGIEDALLEAGGRAAEWRKELAALVDEGIDHVVDVDQEGKRLDVAVATLTGYSRPMLGVVWPELASRAGVTLDARGTRRAAEFTISSPTGGRIQLSGHWELSRSRTTFELRPLREQGRAAPEPRPLVPPMTWDRWAFRIDEMDAASNAWTATLAASEALRVRAWRPGDRLKVKHGDRVIARKVKYFLSDAGISGHIRPRWPVIVVGDEVVWIPGVRRSDAATARSGRPVVTYVCDYLDRRS